MAAKTERLAGRLSRREFTRIGCSVLASLFGRTAFAFYSRPAALNVQLAHEFPKTRNMALAPDGKKICLEDWNSRDYPFRVVEIGTGQTLYSGGLGTRASAQFFADSETLLLETGGRPGERKHPQTVLNIATGERSERYVPLAPEFRSYESFFPLERGIVLIKHTEQKPRYETTSLAIVQYADNHEITKAPFATEVRGPKLRSSSGFEEPGESTYCFCLSDDRKALAYAFDDVVVCRRLPSLEVTWPNTVKKA